MRFTGLTWWSDQKDLMISSRVTTWSTRNTTWSGPKIKDCISALKILKTISPSKNWVTTIPSGLSWLYKKSYLPRLWDSADSAAVSSLDSRLFYKRQSLYTCQQMLRHTPSGGNSLSSWENYAKIPNNATVKGEVPDFPYMLTIISVYRNLYDRG